MEYKDYYNIMGLERNASPEEIKSRYRKLARKYHPDVSKEPHAEVRFKELGEAYEVLKDPEKRAAYDRLGSHWHAGEEFNAPPNWDTGFEFSGSGFSGASFENFSEFFEELFGKGRSHTNYSHQWEFDSRGQDRHAKIEIPLDDTFQGATRSVNLQSPDVDEYGNMRMRQRSLKVKIPKGVKQGQHIRLVGQGTSDVQGRKGDLYLEVQFKPHRYFQVEGGDLLMQLPISPWEAALGTTVKLPIPNSIIDLKIPPGSTSGTKLRLKGKGIPADPAGDIYITLRIVTPPANNSEREALYKEMAQKMAFDPREEMGI